MLTTVPELPLGDGGASVAPSRCSETWPTGSGVPSALSTTRVPFETVACGPIASASAVASTVVALAMTGSVTLLAPRLNCQPALAEPPDTWTVEVVPPTVIDHWSPSAICGSPAGASATVCCQAITGMPPSEPVPVAWRAIAPARAKVVVAGSVAVT